jgi:hypothetical protein
MNLVRCFAVELLFEDALNLAVLDCRGLDIVIQRLCG